MTIFMHTNREGGCKTSAKQKRNAFIRPPFLFCFAVFCKEGEKRERSNCTNLVHHAIAPSSYLLHFSAKFSNLYNDLCCLEHMAGNGKFVFTMAVIATCKDIRTRKTHERESCTISTTTDW